MHAHRAWAERLSALATAGGAGEPPINRDPALSGDENGNRLPIDAYLLARIHGDRPPDDRLDQTPRTLALRIWQQACASSPAPITLSASPPLVTSGDFGSIETWTESLLCATHGLGWLSLRDSVAYPRPRVDRELDWLIEHVEPDNATRHPWAVHLFLDAALSRNCAEAMLYAQDLLHACQIDRRRPPWRSAWILRDSAAWLSRHGEP